jgi:hypothetical protein
MFVNAKAARARLEEQQLNHRQHFRLGLGLAPRRRGYIPASQEPTSSPIAERRSSGAAPANEVYRAQELEKNKNRCGPLFFDIFSVFLV